MRSSAYRFVAFVHRTPVFSNNKVMNDSMFSLPARASVSA